MVHGKKGFERVVWACKNVLDSAVTWLFQDLDEHIQNSTAGGEFYYEDLCDVLASN